MYTSKLLEYLTDFVHQDAQIIEQSLGMSPVQIPQDLWDKLEEHGLCRTPQDEMLHRFRSAPISESLATRYATHIDWMLKAITKASPEIENIRVVFVDGKSLDIDMSLTADECRIHDRWLTWQSTHRQSLCDALPTEDPEIFLCDHVVLKIWDIMMIHLIKSGRYNAIAVLESDLREMARIRLSQMPRTISCTQTNKKGQLRVTWSSTDSHQNRNKPVRVTLHTNECSRQHLTQGIEH